MSEIKKRAARNSKVNETIRKINRTIAKLERTKDEYVARAVEAKANGEKQSYELAKTAINTTLSQIKRAKEMLLNIQITAELQHMAETNSDFLSAMSMLAKSIGKVNKKSNFVKLQKEINKALSGAEEARAGLDTFLQNSESAFESISVSSASLTDDQIERLIAGGISERELLMDEEIEDLMNNVGEGAAQSAGDGTDNVVPVTPATPQVPEMPEIPDLPGMPDLPVAPDFAEPFPMPNGVFDFSAKVSREVPAALAGKYRVAADRPIADGRELVLTGENENRRAYLREFILTQIASLSAKRCRIVLADLSRLGLGAFNGAAQLAADAVTDPVGVLGVVGEVVAECGRRKAAFKTGGVGSIEEYRAGGGAMPYIIMVIDGYSKVYRAEFEKNYRAVLACAQDCGVYTVIGDKDKPEFACGAQAKTVECKTSECVDDRTVSAIVNSCDGGAV